jgi:predicted RNA-binding Zn ribbon-like protein
MEAANAQPALGSFELSGGDPSLDFVNTWGDRGRPDSDRLGSYAHLLAFVRQAGLVDPEVLARLEAGAQADEGAAGAAFAVAGRLREALYGLFSARAHGRALPVAGLATLNEALRKALPHLGLEERGGTTTWRWRMEGGPLEAPLWPLARAAAELLARTPPAPLRECAGAQCTWLFLDVSRSGSRRWCSMTSCGNREKARRHYHRVKKKGPAAG